MSPNLNIVPDSQEWYLGTSSPEARRRLPTALTSPQRKSGGSHHLCLNCGLVGEWRRNSDAARYGILSYVGASRRGNRSPSAPAGGAGIPLQAVRRVW